MSADSAAPLLVAQGVRKHFGGLRAVDGVDLTVQSGEIVGLIGPNGAGKTTLFNCLCGWYRPDEGSIRFDGHRTARLPAYRIARRGLVRTFQITRTLARMSVRENLLVAAQHQLGEHLWAAFLPVLGRMPIAKQEAAVIARADELLGFFPVGSSRG